MKQTFSWEKPADCPQLSLTTYSLVFFKDAEGKEVISSFGADYGSSEDVSHMDLENVAKSAGIAEASEGVIYWGVESKLLSYTVMSSEIRSLTVHRMKGVPATLYLTGEATEFGSGTGKMKNISTGRFEIYTRLSAGNYCFTDAASGEGRKFVIEGTSFKETGAEGTWSEDAVYRITVDAVAGKATVEKITRVYMEVCAFKQSNFTLEYAGNGMWKADGIVPDFTREPGWGGDDPVTAAPERDPQYLVNFWDDNSDWDYHYKVIKSYRGQNGKALNIKLNCSPEEESYYVYLEYLN